MDGVQYSRSVEQHCIRDIALRRHDDKARPSHRLFGWARLWVQCIFAGFVLDTHDTAMPRERSKATQL